MNREELLARYGEPTPVGPHGHVRLVDLMGDDSAIVQAARVSYGKGTKTVNEDTGLIRYLMRHRHTTPLEMCEIKLHLKMPIHVARQWIRHRTASVNEYSTRYSEVPDQFETLQVDTLRMQSASNKQGSSGLMKDQEFVTCDGVQDTGESWAAGFAGAMNDSFFEAHALYEELLEAGAAREQARNVLPLATYTEMYWKIDLHNLLHFLALRMDSHAQQEIREFANAIYQIVKDWVPVTAQAFEDYRLNSVTLSAQEWQVIKEELYGWARESGAAPEVVIAEIKYDLGEVIPNKREQQELLDKLRLN